MTNTTRRNLAILAGIVYGAWLALTVYAGPGPCGVPEGFQCGTDLECSCMHGE